MTWVKNLPFIKLAKNNCILVQLERGNPMDMGLCLLGNGPCAMDCSNQAN